MFDNRQQTGEACKFVSAQQRIDQVLGNHIRILRAHTVICQNIGGEGGRLID
jgi:hypothetical protein